MAAKNRFGQRRIAAFWRGLHSVVNIKLADDDDETISTATARESELSREAVVHREKRPLNRDKSVTSAFPEVVRP